MMKNIKEKIKSLSFIRKKGKKSKVILIVMLVVFNLAGVTFAKYLSEFYTDKVMAIAKDFYFTSDFLSEGTMTHELNNWDTKSEYTFMIDAKNWEDDLRISQMDIVYEITVSGGCTYKVNSLTDAGKGSYTLKSNQKQTDKIIVTVPTTATLDKDTVVVTMKAKMSNGKGYTKTMTGNFHLNKKTEVFAYSIEKNTNYIDLLLGADMENIFTLTYPSCLKPDNTIVELEKAFGGSATFTIAKDKSRMLRFFITGKLQGELVIEAENKKVKIDLPTMKGDDVK